jgi:hypothetical protein
MPWPVDPPTDLPAPRVSKFAARVQPFAPQGLSTGLPDNVAVSVLGALLGDNQATKIVKEHETGNPPISQPTEPAATPNVDQT